MSALAPPAQRAAGDREVVVVTGASAGVGRATVREFARRVRGWAYSPVDGTGSRPRAAKSRTPAARRSWCRSTSPMPRPSKPPPRRSSSAGAVSTSGSTTR